MRAIVLALLLGTHGLVKGQAGEVLTEARALEASGEQAYQLSDIGVAEQAWNTALALRQQAYGDSSTEAAVGYAYQARYHCYMNSTDVGHGALAWSMAQRAKRLLRRSPHVSGPERILVLREFAYAYKIASVGPGLEKHERLARARGYFREALHAAVQMRDTVAWARIHHDVGNTFTDEAGYYRATWPRARIHSMVDSALAHYARSTELMSRAGQPFSEAVMMDHLTTGLLYKDAYGSDSSAKAVAAFNRALRLMLRAVGAPADIDPLHYDPCIANKAQMVELLYLRSLCFASQYEELPDTTRIRSALLSLEAAVPYWQAMLAAYGSRDFHKVLGSYSHFPFNYGTYLAAQLSLINGDEARLGQALRWSDLNRDGLEQRDAMLRGGTGALVHERAGDRSAYRTAPGTVCISFHTYPRALVFVIDADGPRVIRLQSIADERFSFAMRTKGLQEAMRIGDVQAYKRIAHELYTFLLAPVLVDASCRDLVIVPGGEMDGIPFEALVRDTTTGSTWGDLDYVIHNTSVRYARTIDEALRPVGRFSLKAGHWGAARGHDRSELPFSVRSVERLARTHDGGAVSTGLTAADLCGWMKSGTMLHIASHAVVPEELDASPYLVLEDGPFPITAIDSTGCSNTLVTLSTCSSGDGPVFIGEGALSLGRAFLRGGARLVVQTSRPVDDQATSAILEDMYARMASGSSVALALHEAKREHLRVHAYDPLANPFYWSGIMALGVDQRIGSSRSRWWMIAATAIALLGGAVLYRRSRSSRARAET